MLMRTFPANKTTEILKSFDETCQSLMQQLRTQFAKTPDQIDNILKELSETTFSTSEFIFQKTLKNESILVPLINYTLSSDNIETHNTESIKINQTSRFLKMVDVRSLFENLFKTPNFLSEILIYVEDLMKEKTLISNIIQTPFWKKKINKIENDGTILLLPLIIYFDDFEPLNALGSHSGAYKVGGVYCSIACLPSHVQSKLDYIFTIY